MDAVISIPDQLFQIDVGHYLSRWFLCRCFETKALNGPEVTVEFLRSNGLRLPVFNRNSLMMWSLISWIMSLINVYHHEDEDGRCSSSYVSVMAVCSGSIVFYLLGHRWHTNLPPVAHRQSTRAHTHTRARDHLHMLPVQISTHSSLHH